MTKRTVRLQGWVNIDPYGRTGTWWPYASRKDAIQDRWKGETTRRALVLVTYDIKPKKGKRR